MKKIFITTAFLLAIFTFNINATANDEVQETRSVVGQTLNDAVQYIKELFNPTQKKLNDQNDELKILKEKVDRLKNTTGGEVNPTLLKHGKKSMKSCLNNEELYWTGYMWDCRVPTFTQTCDPSSQEEVICDEDGNCNCYQIGTYTTENLGWGVCRDELGDRDTQTGCMFTNAKDGSMYQVEDLHCSRQITRYKQPCGAYGERSTCKCPTGTQYAFKNNKPYCVAQKSCDEANGYYYSSLRNRCEKPIKASYNIIQDYHSCSVGVGPFVMDKENSVFNFGSSTGVVGHPHAHMHSTKRVIEITPQEDFYGIKIEVNNDGNYYTLNGVKYTANTIYLNNNLYRAGVVYRFEFIKSTYEVPNSTYVFAPKLYFETKNVAPSVCEHGEYDAVSNECLISVEENLKCQI